MYILSFDTSSSYCSVAISEGAKILYCLKSEEPNKQAEKLVSMIEKSLLETSLTYKEINFLSVTVGPGSFTGIRIGLATAKGIVLACPTIIPVCIDNFETINFRMRQQVINYDYSVCCIDAYRNEIYVQVYEKRGDKSEIYVKKIEEFKEFIESLNGRVILGGSGINRVYNIKSLPAENITILPRFPYPDARFVCRVAHQKIVQDKINSNIEPLYIRLPDAKIPI